MIVPAAGNEANAPRTRFDLRRRPYSLITLILLASMGVGAVAKRGSIWNSLDVGAARVLLQGRDFYDANVFDTADERRVRARSAALRRTATSSARPGLPTRLNEFTYPPFSALFHVPFVPLDSLSPRLARAVWFVLLSACVVYLNLKAWRLSGGPRLEASEREPPAPLVEQAAFVLGQVCVLQFTLNALTHLQWDLVIGAMLMAGCGALAAGQAFRSATWIGLAAAFKLTPLLFAPYLAWRRQWAAAVWLVAVCVGANLLPNLIHPPPRGGTWVGEWYQLYLRPMGRADYMPGDWGNQLDNNQSLAAAANRWLGARHPRPATVRNAVYGMSLALLLPVLWASFHRRQADAGRASMTNPASPTTHARLPRPVVIECGMVMLLMLLFSPNSSRAHFCIMVLPAFCVARIALITRWTAVQVLLGLAIVCSTLSIHLRANWTFAAEQALLWLGVVTFSAVALLLASVMALARAPSTTA